MNRFFDIPGDTSTQLAPWELKKRNLDPKKAWFVLREPLRFLSDIAGGIIRIEPDYVSDLASIPQFAWSIFMAPDDPRIELGAWIHDLIYQNKGYIVLEGGRQISLTRNQADHILAFEAMADLGASKFQQNAVYEALNLFGDRWH